MVESLVGDGDSSCDETEPRSAKKRGEGGRREGGENGLTLFGVAVEGKERLASA